MTAAVLRHLAAPPATPLARCVSPAARAGLRDLGGHVVSWFEVSGGPRVGAIGAAEGGALERAVRAAGDLGIPLVGALATSGADVTEGVASLHAWGRVARAVADVSGVVPVVMVVTGPCVSGPSLLLGMADHVVMTDHAEAYVSGPGVTAAVTGVAVDRRALGGPHVHASLTGLASLVVATGDPGDPGDPAGAVPAPGPRLILVVEGTASVDGVALARGRAAFVPASEPDAALTGDGVAFTLTTALDQAR